MPNYRRIFRPGGTYFFTLVTHERRPFLCEEASRRILREAIDAIRKEMPFSVNAFVLLPDHLHALWTLPERDYDYSRRWAGSKPASPRHGSVKAVTSEQNQRQ